MSSLPMCTWMQCDSIQNLWFHSGLLAAYTRVEKKKQGRPQAPGGGIDFDCLHYFHDYYGFLDVLKLSAKF